MQINPTNKQFLNPVNTKIPPENLGKTFDRTANSKSLSLDYSNGLSMIKKELPVVGLGTGVVGLTCCVKPSNLKFLPIYVASCLSGLFAYGAISNK